jgi:hypothetical protein
VRYATRSTRAQDKVLLLDLTFVPLAEKMAASWPGVRHYVVMTDRAHMQSTSLHNALCYEDIVAGESPDLESKVAKWQLPDDIVFVPEMPHGATGKVLKIQLWQMFKGHRLPTA